MDDNTFKMKQRGIGYAFEVSFDEGELDFYIHTEPSPDGNEWMTDGEEDVTAYLSKTETGDFIKWIERIMKNYNDELHRIESKQINPLAGIAIALVVSLSIWGLAIGIYIYW